MRNLWHLDRHTGERNRLAPEQEKRTKPNKTSEGKTRNVPKNDRLLFGKKTTKEDGATRVTAESEGGGGGPPPPRG